MRAMHASSMRCPRIHTPPSAPCSSVGFLVTRTCTWTTELLGLASPVVGDQEGTVEGNEGLLELILAVFVDKLLVVGDLDESGQWPVLSWSLIYALTQAI